MKIVGKNTWKEFSPAHNATYKCEWSIHYMHESAAGWIELATGERFVYMYGAGTGDLIVTRYHGRWYVFDTTRTTEHRQSPCGMPDKLIGPFPSRKLAKAAMRIME